LASGATEGSILAYSGGDWVVSTTTTGADNLGNHTASQTLNLNGNWLSGDGDAEGVFVDAAGNVGIGTSSPAVEFEVAGQVSATTVQLNSSGSEVCAGVAQRGTIRVNPSTNRAEICRP